jgi:hypothetical protein
MGTHPNKYSLGTLTIKDKIKEKINKVILIDMIILFFF